MENDIYHVQFVFLLQYFKNNRFEMFILYFLLLD